MSAKEDFLHSFIKISLHKMVDHYLIQLQHALDGLTNEQLWKTPSEHMHSIGSIALHIVEHLDRHMMKLKNKDHELDEGIEHFFPNERMDSTEITMILIDAFVEWGELLLKISQNEKRRNELDIHGLYHLVEHTSYHLGQIMDRVKLETGKSFDFAGKGFEQYFEDMIEQNSF